jgi:predicted phage tail protein
MNLTETYKYRAELAEAKLEGVMELNKEFCKTVSADLTAAHERIKELESQIADTERRVAEDMYQIFLNLLGEKQ